MKFDITMSEHLHDLRQNIHKLGEKYPEVAPYFGLSHAGLLDNETEKLVEKFCFLLTESEANRMSVIANKIKPFMEKIFPEWYRPEVATCIAEFNNFDEFENYFNIIRNNYLITFECKFNRKILYLSTNYDLSLLPISIEKSYFTSTETLTHFHLHFKNQLKNKFNVNNNIIKIYLNTQKYEEVLNLIYYLFDPIFINKKFLFKTNNIEIELDRSFITLPLSDFKFISHNVFFNVKNKLAAIKDILNKLHHYFYIEIKLDNNLYLNTNQFSLHIPLSKNAYYEFNKLENFAKTNCIPIFDIYKERLNTISIYTDNKESEIFISDLKNSHTIELTDCALYDFQTKKIKNLPDYMYPQSKIYFSSEIPFNIEHKFIFDEPYNNKNSYLLANAVLTQLIDNNDNLKNLTLKCTGEINSDFGNIISQPTSSIFYTEVLSDSNFFNFMYNWNYFIGKKIDNLSMFLEYIEYISNLNFIFKDSFFKYFKEIKIIKWKMFARIDAQENPKIISRYFIENNNKKYNFFFDKLLEKILNSLTESDLEYEIKRI